MAAAISLRRRLLVGCAAGGLCLVSTFLSASTFRHAPAVHDITGPLVLGAREKLIWQSEVGPAFQRALRSANAEDQMQVFLPADAETQLAVRVRMDPEANPVTYHLARSHAWQPADNQWARATLASASRLIVEVENYSDVPVHLGAWQRSSLSGRDQSVLSLGCPEKPIQLLGIEIRLVRPDKTFALVGF